MRPIRVWACLVATGLLMLFAGMALATRHVDAKIATVDKGADAVVTAPVACGTVVDEVDADIPEGWTYAGPSCQDKLLQMSRTSLLYLPAGALLVIFTGLVTRTHPLSRKGLSGQPPVSATAGPRPMDNRPATSKLS